MTKKEHLLTIAAEECNEVAQRISKALRFGLEEIQEGQSYSNAERVIHEWLDLSAMMARLIVDGHLKYPPDHSERMRAKLEKVDRLLLYSKQVGTVHED